jgi:membrane protease YdiL (CAAX protease family)
MSQPMDSQEHTPVGTEQIAPNKIAVFGVSVAAIVLVHLPLFLPLWPQLGDWLYPGMFFACGLMVTAPFMLASVVPAVADFNKQWFPHAWSQWLWFVGMVVLVFVCGVASKPLADMLPLKYTPPLLRPSFTPDCSTISAVVLHGILIVLLAPIAEELFWRGYLLEQLRKVTHSGVALLIQSLLFSACHLPLITPRLGGFQAAISTFLFSFVLGVWRIRFRSIVPLILAHFLLNAVASIPILMVQFNFARFAAEAGLEPDFGAKVRSSPECQQIYLLAKEPPEKAVPAIIGFLANPDDYVRACATDTLLKRYPNDIVPYFKEVLASGDTKTIGGVLFVIEMGRFSEMKPDVRRVAWSVDDQSIQLGATITLECLKDIDGLRDIAKNHPNAVVRRAADHIIAMSEKEK